MGTARSRQDGRDMIRGIPSLVEKSAPLRFLVVGGLNTVLTYGIFLALCHLLPAWLGYGVAYVIGIGMSYCGNRYLVFRPRDGGTPKWVYALLQMALLSLGSGITAIATYVFGLGPAVAGFTALLLVTPCSYFLNKKYFTAGAGPALG